MEQLAKAEPLRYIDRLVKICKLRSELESQDEMDYKLHTSNIYQMLKIRGYIDKVEPLAEVLDQKAQERATHVEMRLTHQSEQQRTSTETLVQMQRKVMGLDFSHAVVSASAILVYVYQDQRIPNLDVIKKYLSQVDLVFIICDDGQMKSAKAKVERLFQDEFAGSKKRVELIHHDSFLVNLVTNSHTSHYALTDERTIEFLSQNMHIRLQHLPRIQANDPILMYYGIPQYSVVTQTNASQTIAGQKIDYMYVIPEVADSIYLNHVVTA